MNEYLTDEFLMQIGKVRTPAIVYNLDQLERVVEEVQQTFKDFPIFSLYYSLKAANETVLLAFFAQRVTGADCSSRYEYKLAKSAGFRNISASGVAFSTDDIDAIYLNHQVFNYNSLAQFKASNSEHHNGLFGIRVTVPNEVSPNPYRRFGLNISDPYVCRFLRTHKTRINAIHVHFEMQSVKQLLAVFDFVCHTLASTYVEILNFGGGLSNIFFDQDSLRSGLRTISKNVRIYFPNVKKIIFEPGDLWVSGSGYLVSSVCDMNTSDNQQVAFLDASPWVIAPWTSFRCANISSPSRDKHQYLLAGNSMFEGDWFTTDDRSVPQRFELAQLSLGSKLLFKGFGAYSLVNYRHFSAIPEPQVLYWHNNQFEE